MATAATDNPGVPDGRYAATVRIRSEDQASLTSLAELGATAGPAAVDVGEQATVCLCDRDVSYGSTAAGLG